MLARVVNAAAVALFAVYVAGFSTVVYRSSLSRPSIYQPPDAKSAETRNKRGDAHEEHGSIGNWITHDAAGFFTFWLVVVGIGQAGLFVWQLIYMRKGVRDAEIAATAATEGNKINRESLVETRRAWLNIEDVRIIWPTQITEDGGLLRAAFVVKNYGLTPATRVMIDARHFLASAGDYQHAADKFIREIKGEGPLASGIIFPQESTIVEGLRWEITKEEIQTETRDLPSGGRRLIDFKIFIGVGYRVVGDSDPHITWFPYDFLSVSVGKVFDPFEHRKLQPHAFLAGEAD
jgi:hypothetical protein